MGRVRTVFTCGACGARSQRWAGRCSACGEWNSLVEESERDVAGPIGAAPEPAAPIASVDAEQWQPAGTGVSELDRVLGGGLVPGSVTLLAGEPGTGKSTLALQALHALSAQVGRTLYVSGEESAQQVRLRAERLGCLHPDLWLAAETELGAVLSHVRAVRPAVVVVDSVQTLTDHTGVAGASSPARVREAVAALVREAKSRSVAMLLIGHVTKDGGIAGPRTLEHVVDTVLSFEGERHHALRLLRAVKHRFGSTDELGLFEMTEHGLVPLPDPSELFLTDRQPGVPGSVVMPTLEGRRPLLVEIQALVTEGGGGSPRRSAHGVDQGRLGLVLAVLEERTALSVRTADVHALAAGGVRVTEPAADLPLALAVASARLGVALAPELVAIGEVGLAGELRQVGQTGRRLAEAARLGFTLALVPASAPEPPPGIGLIRAGTLAEALARVCRPSARSLAG